MKHPVITLVNDTHRVKPMRSLGFEKDYGLVGKQYV